MGVQAQVHGEGARGGGVAGGTRPRSWLREGYSPHTDIHISGGKIDRERCAPFPGPSHKLSGQVRSHLHPCVFICCLTQFSQRFVHSCMPASRCCSLCFVCCLRLLAPVCCDATVRWRRSFALARPPRRLYDSSPLSHRDAARAAAPRSRSVACLVDDASVYL